MKRIILSLGMLTFAAAVVVGGTGAFFSDEIVSEDNVFTAGDVTMAANSITHVYTAGSGDEPTFGESGFSFTLDDIKPLDEGTITYDLTNGSNEATVCAMVDETSNNDNGVNNPETVAGDTSDGIGAGELGAFLSFNINGQTGSLAALSGEWQEVGVISAGGPIVNDINYCFGVFNGSDCELDENAVYNFAQTDSLTADVSFYAVQTRNNTFSCADLNEERSVGNADLYTANDRIGAFLSQDWFFYNDTNDTIMSPNQFAADGGTNEIVTFMGRGAAKMVLDAGTQLPDYGGTNDLGNPRYNMATYRFAGTALADIDSLKYTIYDASPSSQTPYLNFNIDFDNSDTWQRRLVHVPQSGTVPVGTWTEVDAIDGGNGLWVTSGGNWPAGLTSNGSIPGGTSGTARTWDDILLDYPTAALRTTDSFFGVRVGHPGPLSEESYVDSIEFDGVLYNFEN